MKLGNFYFVCPICSAVIDEKDVYAVENQDKEGTEIMHLSFTCMICGADTIHKLICCSSHASIPDGWDINKNFNRPFKQNLKLVEK